MAIKFLEEEFQRKMDKIYGKYSAKTDQSFGFAEPFIETKPNDSNLKLKEDGMKAEGRSIPIASTAVDLIRIGKFIASPRGVKFLTTQALLQTGNTFSETRVSSPGWILKNIEPFNHTRRSSTDSTELELTNVSDKDLISRGSILISSNGKAAFTSMGRLQTETSNAVLGLASSKGGILQTLGTSVASTILGTVGIATTAGNGNLGFDERPELMVGKDKQLYSILLQNKYFPLIGSYATQPGGVASAPGTALTIQNLTKKATNWITDSVKKFITGKVEEFLNSKAFNWLRPLVRLVNPNIATKLSKDIFSFKGEYGDFQHRYFIVNDKEARRYLSQISSTGINTLDSEFLKGYGWMGDAAKLTDYEHPTFPSLIIRYSRGYATYDSSGKKVGPDKVHPYEASLEAQKQNWIDNRTAEINAILSDSSKNKKIALSPGLKSTQNTTYGFGWTGPNKTETQVPGANSKTKYVNTELDIYDITNKPDYHVYRDDINMEAPFDGSEGTANNIKDLIDFRIRVVGDKTVRFRSIIERFSEDIKPNFSTVPYIGRIERNITYTGVERNVSMDFIVHAYSPEELDIIWKKLNFLTGMAFPREYNNGFMVPCLLQLTIGNVFNNQPCYLTSLNYSIDENTSWDTLDTAEVPLTVHISSGFSIIEKDAMNLKTQSMFHGVGKLEGTTQKNVLKGLTNDALNSLIGKNSAKSVNDFINRELQKVQDSSKQSFLNTNFKEVAVPKDIQKNTQNSSIDLANELAKKIKNPFGK